jgi:hypothetical protein
VHITLLSCAAGILAAFDAIGFARSFIAKKSFLYRAFPWGLSTVIEGLHFLKDFCCVKAENHEADILPIYMPISAQ